MDNASSRLLPSLIIGAAITSMALAEVTIPPGFEIVQITDFNSGTNSGTDINNCGEIAFFSGAVGRSFEIMVYDNGNLKRITDDDHSDVFPKINDNGLMVWNRRLVNWGSQQVVRYENGEVTVLAEDPVQLGQLRAINNLDHIAWSQAVDPPGECAGLHDAEVMFYDGDTITQITDEGYGNTVGGINGEDAMVWGEFSNCTDPEVIRVWLHVGSVFTEVYGGSSPSVPSINDWTQVSWSPGGGILVWDNGTTREVLPGGWNPKINNSESIFYISPFGPTWEAFMLHESVVYQLTDTSSINSFGSINNWDECAWQAEGSGSSEIAHLRRIRTGDAEFDGDVDLSDHNAMANCITGHGRVDRLCDCRFLDIDHDGDVDLMDVAIFNNNFTGG